MPSQIRLLALLCACAALVGACCPALASANTQRGRRAATKAPALSVAISLRERHRRQLTAFIRELDTPGSPGFGHPLTPAQFRARFSPTAAHANRVVRFLRRLGLRQVNLSGNRLFVTAQASLAAAKKAFRVRIATYHHAGRTIYSSVSEPSVPAAIAGNVQAVVGLNDFSDFARPMRAADLTAAAPADCSQPAPSVPKPLGACYYTPSAFRTAYDAGSLTGTGVPIAIMAEGNLAPTIKDLRAAEASFGEPAVPYTIERVGRRGRDRSATAEWALDAQYSTAMAPGVSRLYLYDVRRLTDANVALEINRWVSQDLTKLASASFGECELLPHADGTMAAGDEIMSEAAAQGQTLFVASGDGGGQRCRARSHHGRTLTLHELNYPCTSEYVVCVGGTSLYTNADGSYQQELAWHASGGGTSSFERRPQWQRCMATSANSSAHGEPDIAMDAGINTGAEVVYRRGRRLIGGTSLSAPLALGAWADIESAAGDTFGPASELLYRLYPSSPCTSIAPPPLTAPLGTATADPSYPFHDVYLGSNAGYPARLGWDYATGLGSIDIAKVSAALNALSAPAAAPA
jgi:pseudomonalisin/xanthomonalisin